MSEAPSKMSKRQLKKQKFLEDRVKHLTGGHNPQIPEVRVTSPSESNQSKKRKDEHATVKDNLKRVKRSEQGLEVNNNEEASLQELDHMEATGSQVRKTRGVRTQEKRKVARTVSALSSSKDPSPSAKAASKKIKILQKASASTTLLSPHQADRIRAETAEPLPTSTFPHTHPLPEPRSQTAENLYTPPDLQEPLQHEIENEETVIEEDLGVNESNNNHDGSQSGQSINHGSSVTNVNPRSVAPLVSSTDTQESDSERGGPVSITNTTKGTGLALSGVAFDNQQRLDFAELKFAGLKDFIEALLDTFPPLQMPQNLDIIPNLRLVGQQFDNETEPVIWLTSLMVPPSDAYAAEIPSWELGGMKVKSVRWNGSGYLIAIKMPPWHRPYSGGTIRGYTQRAFKGLKQMSWHGFSLEGATYFPGYKPALTMESSTRHVLKEYCKTNGLSFKSNDSKRTLFDIFDHHRPGWEMPVVPEPLEGEQKVEWRILETGSI